MEHSQKEIGVLRTIETAYTTGHFEAIFPLMTDDYTHVSFWVAEVLRGKAQARDYYEGKGETLRKSGSFPKAIFVRIVSAPDRVRPRGVWKDGVQVLEDPVFLHRSDAGKGAILFEQQLNGKTVCTLAIPTITENGKLAQILITNPGFYRLERIGEAAP
jgi:hypothetical protein